MLTDPALPPGAVDLGLSPAEENRRSNVGVEAGAGFLERAPPPTPPASVFFRDGFLPRRLLRAVGDAIVQPV